MSDYLRVSRRRDTPRERPWRLPIDAFVAFAGNGRLHEATGVASPGEQKAETPLRMGELNKYSYQDIAHFYLWRRRGDPESGYLEFMADAFFEGKDLSENACQSVDQIAQCEKTCRCNQ